MCSTCVDRIFTSGPASCPVPYCGKTLRKKGFHKAFFGDLKIEREVDIRKRVGAIYNLRQNDFNTLLDWNNYLEMIEGLVFDLMNGSKEEKAAAETNLQKYKADNAKRIDENRKEIIEELELAKRREQAEKDAARQRRLAAMREEEEEKKDVVKSKMDILDRLASTNESATKITSQAQKIVLKKSSARRGLADSAVKEESNGSVLGDSHLTIRGLKIKEAPVAEKPYDPFGGLDLKPSRYVLQNDYETEWLAGAKKEPRHMAGGYSMHEYYARTMFEAFSGLGVFIEDEVAGRPQPAVSASTGTAAAAHASGVKIKLEHKTESDDVF
jgi:CDK-activating kinase assembly factor MAT1